jgi:hypothetical protein
MAELQLLIVVSITQDDGYDAISTALADVSTETPRRTKTQLERSRQRLIGAFERRSSMAR